MPETIITTELAGRSLSRHDNFQIYNGLDCAVTLEVFREIEPLLTEPSQIIYNFERAMQAPALEMMLRGIRVDQYHRWVNIADLEAKADKVQIILNEFAMAVWDRPLNPQSPKQLADFFYGVMKLPEQYSFKKGQKKLSTDREALEKLALYFHAEPIVNCILKLRDLRKLVSVLKTEVDDDSRMRTSYNVAGTETNRWSSSSNAFGGGTNLQNITESLRRMFVADDGWKLAYIDLEQAESRAVGWICWVLFGASAYLDACESGDLHTYVCKLIWKSLGWTGDPKRDKEKAESPFFRHFSYRDMAKRGGHGTNYYGKPPNIARILKVKRDLIEDFQHGYFAAFPEIPEYHKWAARNIGINQYLPTPLGTGRHFFGRPGDDATLREGIAYVPQHMVGVLLNLALWRLWKYLGTQIQLLGQIHDAVLFQYKEADEAIILPQAVALMATPLSHNGRTMTIPSEVMVGWNWAKFNPKEPLTNPDGLMKLKGTDDRTRAESAKIRGLDRLIS